MVQKLLEFIRYGFWGGITTAINLIIFFVLNYLGINYILANAIGFIIAVIVNYILNKKYVFKNDTDNERIQIVKYMLMRLLSLGIDSILFYLFVSVMSFNVYITRIFLSIVLILAMYLISRVYIFVGKTNQ